MYVMIWDIKSNVDAIIIKDTQEMGHDQIKFYADCSWCSL